MKFLSQLDTDGSPYYRIENSTLSFGVVGLFETVRILNGGVYDTDLATRILEQINRYANQLIKETGYRWSVIASPAESTAGKFGIINRQKYGDRALVNGTTGAYYQTNGTHLPVNADVLLPQKIMTETPFHALTQGGNIMNIFMGESWADPMALKSLTQKIYENTNVGFWAYSTVLVLCKECSTRLDTDATECHNCHSTDLEYYDRITGYVQRVSGWNPSKEAEFKDRRRFTK
jgi:ribonucleoside-triphosphate reductase